MHKIESLPYSYDALEPYYGREMLRIHHDILYKGYADSLNVTESKLKTAMDNSDYTNIKCLKKDLSFNGSGYILHTMFFQNMGMPKTFFPTSHLIEQINKDFNSFEAFKNQFSEAALKVEGSGWCILGWHPMFNKLEILQCEKHQNLTLWGIIPILVLDVWEHSYFLQYKSEKSEYIEKWWEIVNWQVVSRRFESLFIRN